MIKTAQQGFTLIELVMVLVIVGILSAIALPKFVDLSSAASTAAQKESKMAARAAFTTLLAQNSATTPTNPYPTLSALVSNLDGATEATNHSGVCMGNHNKAPTFKDLAGATATSASADQVQSLGAVVTDNTNC